MTSPVRILGLCAALAACSDGPPAPVDARSEYRSAGRFAGQDVAGEACRNLVQRLGAEALVFAQDLATAQAFTGSATDAPTPPGPARLVTIVDETVTATPGERTALVVAPTGAAVAIDVALLACHGIAPPPRLALGARMRMADGTTLTQPSPSDFVINKLLRLDHAELLDPGYRGDVVFRVGLVTQHEGGVDRLVREQAVATAARHPQLELTARHAGGDATRVEASARELLDAGARAILVRTDDPGALGALAADMAERSATLVVLDPTAECEIGTCCIGADQYTLGRAAGEAAHMLAPNGAQVVLLAADAPAGNTALRERGFGDALGMPAR